MDLNSPNWSETVPNRPKLIKIDKLTGVVKDLVDKEDTAIDRLTGVVQKFGHKEDTEIDKLTGVVEKLVNKKDTAQLTEKAAKRSLEKMEKMTENLSAKFEQLTEKLALEKLEKQQNDKLANAKRIAKFSRIEEEPAEDST